MGKSIKELVISEVESRKLMRKNDRLTYKGLAREVNMSYNGLLMWVNNDGRSIGSEKLDQIAEVLGKKFVLVDKNI